MNRTTSTMITMITIAPKLINMEYSSGVCLGVKRGCLIRLNRAGGWMAGVGAALLTRTGDPPC
jgi:hypothetical protein